MENYIDTRDLQELRIELKDQILEDFNSTFNTELEYFEDIDTFLNDEDSSNITSNEREDFNEYWKGEMEQIKEIDEIENNVDEFEFGCTLIHEDYFEEYTEEMLIDCGDLPKDLPTWIEIDWSSTADNVKQDYSEVEYQGETYYFR